MRTWNGFRWLSAKEKERKCPLDLSSYPRLHCECWKGFFSCVLQVTTAIISRHITAVIHREFYKGQRDSQTASMVSGTEPITAASGKEKQPIDRKFWALRNDWAIPGCSSSALTVSSFLTSKNKESWRSQVMPKKKFQFRNKEVKDKE